MMKCAILEAGVYKSVGLKTLMATLQLRQIRVPEGQTLEIQDVSWSEFDSILQELGENRNTRIAYGNETLIIVAPMPAHEFAKVCIGDFIKIILEELDQPYLSLGSTTFKNDAMNKAVEPDDCFYIRQYKKVLGKARLDLQVDPPPELAIEIDIISKTQLQAYEGLGVGELWRYDEQHLMIYVLVNGKYREVEQSPTFPSWFTKQVIEQFVARALVISPGMAKKEFRQWVMTQLSNAS
ncbi:MAG: Uma2 family endonuclease [Cyanobacteria bacterium J06643_4]